MPRGTDNAIKIADGSIERMIFSNFNVKSKFPRQPSTVGPKETSLTHLDNSMPGTGSGWIAALWPESGYRNRTLYVV